MIEINNEKVNIDGSTSEIANDIANLCYSLVCHGYPKSAIIEACALGIGKADLQSRDDSSDEGKTGKTDTVTMSKFDDLFGQLFRDDERGISL